MSAWFRVLNGLLGYWYERGLADALRTGSALDELLSGAWSEAPIVKSMDVDLGDGLDRCLDAVENVRPDAVVLCVGDTRIGDIPSRPGTERLGARHVAAALVQQYHLPLVSALLARGELSFGTGHAGQRRELSPATNESSVNVRHS